MKDKQARERIERIESMLLNKYIPDLSVDYRSVLGRINKIDDLMAHINEIEFRLKLLMDYLQLEESKPEKTRLVKKEKE